MEETLTNYLLNIQDDLRHMKRIRDYLDSNTETQHLSTCSLTSNTVEAFNNILLKYTAAEVADVESLNALLDSFYLVVSNNIDRTAWNNFGFELGVVCVKILSVIESTDAFEILFCKLLSVINVICEHTHEVWKAVARQTLNVFINKKLSIHCLETGLKLYVSILRNIDGLTLYNFARQNFHLLKTLSNLVQVAGDFEIQMDIMELVFLHTSSDKQLIGNFFLESRRDVSTLFMKLGFADFEGDCRTYLNAVNSVLGGDRQVYSIKCLKIHVGGCSLVPPTGSQVFWLDVNGRSERLSTKCSDLHAGSLSQTLVYIQFLDLLNVEWNERENETRCRLVIKAKNLNRIVQSVTTDEIICTIQRDSDNSEKDVENFVSFLREALRKKWKKQERLSQALSEISTDRDEIESSMEKSQKNSRERHSTDKKERKINNIIPKALSLLTKVEKKKNSEAVVKDTNRIQLVDTEEDEADIEHQPSGSGSNRSTFFYKSPSPVVPIDAGGHKDIQKVVPESEELSPKSFIESLNKNLGLDSPNGVHSFEKSLESMIFQSVESEKMTHKLFRSPDTVFNFLDVKVVSSDLENVDPPKKTKKPSKAKNKNSKGKTAKPSVGDNVKKTITAKRRLQLTLDSQSDSHCFRGESAENKRKPSLPKLNLTLRSHSKKLNEVEKEKGSIRATQVPSLLDPNGYAYKRWMKPTTSERSQFWLNKLTELEEKREKAVNNVFEYVDDVELVQFRKNKKVGKGKKPPTTAKTPKPKAENRKKPRKGTKRPELKNLLRSEGGKRGRNAVTKGKENRMPTEQKTKKGKAKEEQEQEVEEEERRWLEVMKTVEPSESQSKNLGRTNRDNGEMGESRLETSTKENREESLAQGNEEQETKVPDGKGESPTGMDEDNPEQSYDRLILQRGSSHDSIMDNDFDKNLQDAQGGHGDMRNEEAEMKKTGNEASEREEEEDCDLSEIEAELFQESEPEWVSKRGRYDEENSTLNSTSKRQKSNLNGTLQVLRLRLQRLEAAAKQETDEIIKAFDSGITRAINGFHLREAKGVVEYLRNAQEIASTLIDADFQALNRRMEKVFVYQKARCSIGDVCESVRANASSFRQSMSQLVRREKPVWRKIQVFGGRLSEAIEKEIDRTIDREITSFRHRILQFAPLFDDLL